MSTKKQKIRQNIGVRLYFKKKNKIKISITLRLRELKYNKANGVS